MKKKDYLSIRVYYRVYTEDDDYAENFTSRKDAESAADECLKKYGDAWLDCYAEVDGHCAVAATMGEAVTALLESLE
jgi:hypothetical protein